MEYGHFDDERREYVISRPDPPLPWINYLGNDGFFGIISNTAGGCCFYRDARLRRLTRYRHNTVPSDCGGRYLYLRDDADGTFWSPTWQPVRSQLDSYECRHGLSYTRISSTAHGLGGDLLYFVPLEENLEIWRLSLTNLRDRPATVSVFSAVEFCLWDALDDATNFQRNLSIGEVEVEGEGRILYHKSEYRERRNHFAYFACSAPVLGFDTQREGFLGNGRDWTAPLAVDRGASFNSVAHGWSPVASHWLRVELAPGACEEIVFLLGYGENPPGDKFDPPGSQTIDKSRIRPVIERWLDPAEVREGFAALGRHWSGVLNTLQVSTPDADTNRMVNTWNPYQCMVTFNLSRSISLYESGIGRGMGFRDSSQDLLGCVHLLPERARQRLCDLAATQLPDGAVYHQYQPLTKRGNNDIGSGFNDDPLWLVLAVAAYVKETGDLAVLDEKVPYDLVAGSEETLFEHLGRCTDFTLARLGPHGLPLIGRADWNDCLNLNCFSESSGESFQTVENREGTVAESVFIAAQFVLAANELAALADRRRCHEVAESCRAAAREVSAAVDRSGWDGRWYLRAYDAMGRPVGTHADPEGQIFLEPQGFCAMAGIGLADGRSELALESVRERLATEHGLMLIAPPYHRYHLELGEISSYPPGYKENGSVFCHVNPWIIIAEAVLGHGDAAFDYYKRTNPSKRAAVSELHRCEPYVYAQMIAGRDAPSFGEAKNSWLTGAAAWHMTAVSQWILGIRPELDGLRIDPVLPAPWSGFSARRSWRGATFDIRVHKEVGLTGRVRSLVVDGEPVEGNLLAPAAEGADVVVEARVEVAAVL